MEGRRSHLPEVRVGGHLLHQPAVHLSWRPAWLWPGHHGRHVHMVVDVLVGSGVMVGHHAIGFVVGGHAVDINR